NFHKSLHSSHIRKIIPSCAYLRTRHWDRNRGGFLERFLLQGTTYRRVHGLRDVSCPSALLRRILAGVCLHLRDRARNQYRGLLKPTVRLYLPYKTEKCNHLRLSSIVFRWGISDPGAVVL